MCRRPPALRLCMICSCIAANCKYTDALTLRFDFRSRTFVCFSAATQLRTRNFLDLTKDSFNITYDDLYMIGVLEYNQKHIVTLSEC